MTKWLCAIQGWHWSYARVVSQVKLYKWRLSSGCLQFKVSYLKVIKWISSVPVLAVEVCKYLLASRDVQVTVFKWIYSAQCLAVEAWKYGLASEVAQVKVVNSCAEALRQKCTTRQRHERHVKKTNANIEFTCYLVPVCVRLEVTTLFIGQKKSVINRLNKFCEHCSVALSCNMQVCGFLVATLSVCYILAAEPTEVTNLSENAHMLFSVVFGCFQRIAFPPARFKLLPQVVL